MEMSVQPDRSHLRAAERSLHQAVTSLWTYDNIVDRESAFEVLLTESEQAAKEATTAHKARKSSSASQTQGTLASLSKSKVFKAVTTAIVGTVATAAGTAVSNKVSGKTSKTSGKDVAGRAIKNGTSAATRQILRNVLGTILK